MASPPGTVIGVHRSPVHGFSKAPAEGIVLLAGLGVEGDAHCGATVQHRSRVARAPMAPNLRQVHLLHAELLDELAAGGELVGPGELGENVTTRGVDLLALPVGTRLALGGTAVVELTGLRNPCRQIDRFRPGLRARVVERGPGGRRVRKAGAMAVVVVGGPVAPGDGVALHLPSGPHRPLEPV
jgi:MOSC domain-containing protein YiiM